MSLKQKLDSVEFQNERNISIKYLIEDEIMFIRSRLADDHHNICLDWKIDIPTHTVIDIETRMEDIPFKDCAIALKTINNIKGLEVAVGVKKDFRKRFLKQEGCTHITELAFITFEFIIARLYGPESARMSEKEKAKRRYMIASFLCNNNSCVIFNKDQFQNFDNKGHYRGKEYSY